MDDVGDSPPSRRSPIAEQRRLALLSTKQADDEHEIVLIDPAVQRVSNAELSLESLDSAICGGSNDNDSRTCPEAVADDLPPAP